MPIHRLLLLSLALLLSACNKPDPNQLTADKPPVQLSSPIDYLATPDQQLGINENGKGLKPGTKLGAINLTSISGEGVALESIWQQQPTLIIFYRGGWCPYCNAQVRELSLHHQSFLDAGVQTVLISVDAPARANLIDAEYDIPFPVLSDTELLAHFAFNVALELEQTSLETMREKGLIPANWSGLNHNTIAVASAFVVDRQGIVRFSHAPANFRARPSAEQLLNIVQLLKLK